MAKNRNSAYLIGTIIPVVVLINSLALLLNFPSKAKFFLIIGYCIISTIVKRRFEGLFIIFSFTHIFISMYSALRADITFPGFSIILSYYLFVGLIGSYRNLNLSKSLLSLISILFIVFHISSPNVLFMEMGFSIRILLYSFLVYLSMKSIFETVEKIIKNKEQVLQEFINVVKSSLSILNGILLIVLSFSIYNLFDSNKQNQQEGNTMISRILSDLTQFFSKDTRDAIIKYFSVEGYEWTLIMLIVSIFLFTVANNHSKKWYGVPYNELILGKKRKSEDVFLSGPIGFFSWGFGLLVYWFVVVYSFPNTFSYFFGPVTWKTTLLELAIGLAFGFCLGFIIKVLNTTKNIKFKILRMYFVKPWYLRMIRFAILFGPAVLVAPFFAWKSLIVTALLIIGCYSTIELITI